MPDTLSVGIGTVLSVLEIVESKYGSISDVTLIKLEGIPTNIIEFTIDGTRFEVLVNEKRFSATPRTRPAIHRVKLDIKEHQKTIEEALPEGAEGS